MDKIRFQKVLRQAFWIPFVIAVILAAILIVEVQFLTKPSAWVEHTDQVIAVSQRLYQNRIDQETGLRAYLLTSDERFLQPLYEARKEARKLEAQLQQLISDDPEQLTRIKESAVAFREWSSWADQTMAL